MLPIDRDYIMQASPDREVPEKNKKNVEISNKTCNIQHAEGGRIETDRDKGTEKQDEDRETSQERQTVSPRTKKTYEKFTFFHEISKTKKKTRQTSNDKGTGKKKAKAKTMAKK
jgi:hypothetical protein